VFTLDAFDVLKKKRSLSKLSLEAKISRTDSVRTFSEESYKTSYKFQYGAKDAKRKILQTRYGQAVANYLKDEIGDYDAYLDALGASLNPGAGPAQKFGNVLTSLDISMPGNVVSAWMNMPTNFDHDFYKKMSGVVQKRLREWISAVYIEKEDDYDDTDDIYPLLAYSALPLLQKSTVDDGISFFHWKYQDETTRKEVFDAHCQAKILADILPRVRKETDNHAYDDAKIGEIRKVILDGNSANFITLCKFEKETIRNIVKTAKLLFAFQDTPENQPDERSEALSKFGIEFTDTFNDDLGHIKYTPKGSLRPLGLILIKDIADLLNPGIGSEEFVAMLELTVLKPTTDFEKARTKFFDEGVTPEPKDTIVQQRMLSTGT
jgi:hypothetical protein